MGLGEDEARGQGLRVRVKSEKVQKVPGWFTARRLAEPIYGYKTLVEEDTGRILGAHIVGPSAEEVINVFALAIRHGLCRSAFSVSILLSGFQRDRKRAGDAS